MRWIELRVATLVVAATTLGCAVGPDYERPDLRVPDGYGAATEQPAPDALIEVDWDAQLERKQQLRVDLEAQELATWWQVFEDPLMASLIERAVLGSPRVDIALARLREARTAVRARSGRLRPAVGASGSAGESRASANGPGPLGSLAEAGLASLENRQYTVGFDVGWEIDLFGGVRRGRESAAARAQAARESVRGTLLLLAAETARSYIDLRGAELRLALAERNLQIQEDTLLVIEGKVDTGLLPPIDLDRTRTQRATILASLAPLRAQRAAAVHRLGVLLGESPRALEAELSRTEEGLEGLPEPPEAIVAGLPADLLLRRPDLRAAERELAASTADIGAALADRFPSLSFGGSLGLESASLGDLIDSGSRTWSFGPSVQLPVFQGGRLAAQVEAARARLQSASASFELSVLRAVEETETGLVALRESGAARRALEDAVLFSRQTSEHAGTLYELGLRDHLILLDAQRNQTAVEDALAVARIDQAQNAVGLYLALGGGWFELESVREVSASGVPEESR